MYAELHECLLNVRHRVCGYRLRPLCYDHLEALHATGCPLPFRRSQVTSADLLVALRICSMDGERLESDMPFGRLSWRDFMTVFKHWILPVTLARDLRKFEAYLEDHAAAPKVADATVMDGIHEVYMPSVPGLFARLTGVLIAYKGAISERRARSMPIGLLLHYWELARHHNGSGCPFVDEEMDDEIEAALKAADEAGAQLLKAMQSGKENSHA
jgi:hypothetical protein